MPIALVAQGNDSGGMICRLGWGDMVFCFFSSVSYNLEGPGKWGTRFPRLLQDLCDCGIVENEHFDELRQELYTVRVELQDYPLSAAVYDIADPSIPIPWEVIPGEENNNLAQPWVTPRSGTSYFDCFEELMQWAENIHAPLRLMLSREAFAEKFTDNCKKGRDYFKSDVPEHH